MQQNPSTAAALLEAAQVAESKNPRRPPIPPSWTLSTAWNSAWNSSPRPPSTAQNGRTIDLLAVSHRRRVTSARHRHLATNDACASTTATAIRRVDVRQLGSPPTPRRADQPSSSSFRGRARPNAVHVVYLWTTATTDYRMPQLRSCSQCR